VSGVDRKILNAKSPGVQMRMVKIGRPVMVTQFNLFLFVAMPYFFKIIFLCYFYCFETLYQNEFLKIKDSILMYF